MKEENLAPLKPSELTFGIHAYRQFSCRVAAGVSKEDLLKPGFWSFVVPRLDMGTEIRVVPNDFSYRALLLVTYTDGKNVRLKLLNYVELDDVKVEIQPSHAKNYSLHLRGQQKWCVKRLSDAEFIKELIPTKQEAVVWLEKYVLMLEGDKDAAAWIDRF